MKAAPVKTASAGLGPIIDWLLSRLDKNLLIAATMVLFITGTGYALYQPVHPDPWHVHSSWDKFIYPQEKNAFLRQPAISANINDVTSIDGQLWAVGDGGLILHSRDGGLCWTPKGPWVESVGQTTCPAAKTGLQRVFSGLSASLETENLFNGLFTNAHAADEPTPRTSVPVIKKAPTRQQVNPVIQQNVEQTINIEEPVPLEIDVKAKVDVTVKQPVESVSDTNDSKSIPSLSSVRFIDTQTGIAVGNSGTILRTSDGGVSWAPLDSGTRSSLNSISAIGTDTFIAVGLEGTILRSIDRGVSWAPVDSGPRSRLTSISAIGTDTFIAVGDRGTMLRSVDRGVSWVLVDSGARSWLTSISAIGTDTFIAVGLEGTILRSVDRGVSWIAVDSGTRSSLEYVSAIGTDTFIAVGNDGTMLRSVDRGVSWAPVDSGTRSRLNSISAIGTDTFIAVGNDGRMLRSVDRGVSWVAVDSGTRSWLNSISAIGTDTFIAVGLESTMLRSVDRGVSWVALDSGTRSSLFSISAIGTDTFIAVGNDGTMLRSVDHGVSWVLVDSGTRSSLTSISAIGTDTFIAVGDRGTMLRSVDRSVSWVALDSGSRSWLTSISAIGTDTFIAVGNDGTMLRSVDRGVSWVPVNSGSQSSLNSISAIGTDTFIAVGQGGTILRSVDRGVSWVPVDNGARSWLTSISAIGTDTFIAVGQGGTILRSVDRGISWVTVNSGTRSSLNSISAIGTDTFIAVGDDGTILRSNDAGLRWKSIDDYSVSIANWWYLLLALCIGLVLFIVWPRMQKADDEGIAGLAASDRPLQPGDPDALNLNGIAADITTFLSNPKTTAPLTMAITGPWGSGKSSLMNLVRADLEQRGFSPVWFNAWHHQKGEQLLASLFAHIKQQAIPGWFSFDGWWFRLKLAFMRSYQHWFIFAILMGLLFFTLSINRPEITVVMHKLVLLQDPDNWWGIPWESWMPNLQNFFQSGDWIQTLAGIIGIGTPVVALLRSIRGFGLNPAKLVSIDQGMDTKKGYDPGARARFAREFNDVTRALGHNKMVIFIDDLDRCSQENLIDILENINFLSSSGDCFLILGMAPKYIEACVANAYEKLAQSISEKELHDNQNHFENEQTHKFRFAHNYLEKMINIEVTIPQMQANSIDQLFNLQESLEVKTSWPQKLKSLWHLVNNSAHIVAPVFIILVMVSFGWEYARKIPDQPEAPEPPHFELGPLNQQDLLSLAQDSSNRAYSEKLALVPRGTRDKEQAPEFSLALQAHEEELKEGIKIASLGQGKEKANLLLKLNPKTETTEVVQQPVSDSQDTSEKPAEKESSNIPAEFRQAAYETEGRLSGIKLLFGLLLFGSFAYYLYKKKRDKYSDDSEDFKQALVTWTPWIQLKQETPRAVKRFLNHLRFLAIRNNQQLSESTLVGIAAIYFFNQPWVQEEDQFNDVMQGNVSKLLTDLYKIDVTQKEYSAEIMKIAKRLQTSIDEVDSAELIANRSTAIDIIKGALAETSQKEQPDFESTMEMMATV